MSGRDAALLPAPGAVALLPALGAAALGALHTPAFVRTSLWWLSLLCVAALATLVWRATPLRAANLPDSGAPAEPVTTRSCPEQTPPNPCSFRTAAPRHAPG